MKACEGKKERESLVGRPVSLRSLVEYQEGAIVSRTVVEKESGTITLFAFAEGQGLSEHTTPFDAVVHILEGEAEISISGEPLQVRAGEMVIMPANEPHAVKAVSRLKMMLVMVKE